MLGLDACRGGWAGVAWSGSGEGEGAGAAVRGFVGDAAEDVIGAAVRALGVRVVGVDMPIGLPDGGVRRADVLARAVLGPRRSSVFCAPPRAVLEAPSYAEARALSRRMGGPAPTAQAYALRAKTLEVDALVRGGLVRDAGLRVVEVHPEAAFAELAGRPLAAAKRTWAGLEHRRALLAAAGLVVPVDLGALGERAHADDVLDAAAAAWTARRVQRGEARCLPDPPEVFADGWPAAIWV